MALEQSKDVVAAIMSIAVAIEAAKKDDGAIGWGDVNKLIPVVIAAHQAISGATKIKDELSGISGDPEAMAEILTATLLSCVRLVQAVIK
jgi:hypothetical protein